MHPISYVSRPCAVIRLFPGRVAPLVSTATNPFLLASLVILAIAVALPTAAHAGQAASGELFFYPCSTCHPVTPGADGTPDRSLPNGFTAHQVPLVGHDLLGEGGVACLVCHDDPANDPGQLKLIDGTLVDITGDTSLVCFRCHSEKYRDWEAGTHGRGEAGCSAAGCHDPHTPAWIYGEPLLPFVGTGFQVRVVSERQAFTPFAGPPVSAPVETPSWLALAAACVGFLAAGVIGFMIRGGSAHE